MSRLPHAGYPSHSYLFLVYPYLTGWPWLPKQEVLRPGVEEEGRGRTWGERLWGLGCRAVGGRGAHTCVTALTPAAGVEPGSLRPSGSASVLDK